jgi:GH15 family glucan-1,4-alpha-glucosidase
LGHQALRRWDQDDAGLWELRNSRHVHTFSSVMCWAACDRLSRIASQLRLKGRAGYWRRQAEKIRAGIMERAWNRRLGAFTHTFDGKDVDASLLLLAELGFVEPDDKRFLGTLALVEKRLRRGDYMLRYATADDFGMPENAFNICTFWYLGALASVGRRDEARALFENMLAKRNTAGLLSEDLDPETGQLWGNFPQTYSLVGLIQTAMRLSKSWEDAF